MMRYNVLKEVMIDGHRRNAGETIEFLTPPDRLILLGYLAPEHDEKPVENRAVKPKRKRKE